MTIFFTALVSLLGIGFGALLQHVLSRSTEARKLAYAARNQAYVDYLKAVAHAAHALTAEEQARALFLAADAKARIAVYGEEATLEALAALEEVGPVLNNPTSRSAFLKLASSMRGQTGQVDHHVLALVLLGSAREGLPELDGKPRPP